VGTLVGEVAALGLAIAFTSPVSVVTVIVMLSMPAGRRRALAFVCGWVVAIAGIGVLALLVFHGQDFSTKHSTPSRAASAVEVLLGCLLLIAAVVAYRRRRPSVEAAGVSEPRWLERVERTHWFMAVPVGAIMLSYALSLVAASEILKADVSRLDGSAAFAVFALTSVVTIAAPIVVALVAPERSEATLARWKAWLLVNSRSVVLVVLMVVSALVIVRGVYDLVA
jgi:hypothetical protein